MWSRVICIKTTFNDKSVMERNCYRPHPHVKHYHIKQNQRGEFYLSEKHCCGSIPDLVNYHRHNSGGLASRLKASPCDRPVPPTAGLSHGMYIDILSHSPSPSSSPSFVWLNWADTVAWYAINSVGDVMKYCFRWIWKRWNEVDWAYVLA